jgi:hypothetical protein
LSVLISIPAEEGRASTRSLDWEGWKILIEENKGERQIDVVYDSDGNIHGVWVDLGGNITYAKMLANGSFIVGPYYLGTSDRNEEANPRMDLDASEDIHVTWSNSSGPNGEKEFEYVRLDKAGSVKFRDHGAGGDVILGTANGFAALRHYNWSTGPVEGPINLTFYDHQANPGTTLMVGQQVRDFDMADMTLDSSGNIYIVYLMDETTMNLTKVVGEAVNIDQMNLLTMMNGIYMPKITTDHEDKVHILWIDGKPQESQGGLPHHMKIDTDASVLVAMHSIEGIYEYFCPRELDITRAQDHDYIGVIGRGSYSDMGSGGGEAPGFIVFTSLSTDDGSTLEITEEWKGYCGGPPAITSSRYDRFNLFYGQRVCESGAGGPSNNYGNLHMNRTVGQEYVDLSISEEDIVYPDRIFPGEEFPLKITVWNRGTKGPVDFEVEVIDKVSSNVLFNDSDVLVEKGNQSFEYLMTIHDITEITINVHPWVEMDTNLTNNTVDLTLTPVPRPDLAIHGKNITFSEIGPAPGEQVEITAQVNNLGGGPAEFDVSFLDGTNGPEIGHRHMFITGFVNQTSIFWTPQESRLHIIAVVIDNVTPAELPDDLDNNKNNTSIMVASHNIPSVEITDPVHGAEVDIELGEMNITGRAWDLDGDDLDVLIQVDSGPWDPVTSELVNGTLEWRIRWAISSMVLGEHRITAKVEDDAHSNETSVNFTLIDPLPVFEIVNWTPIKDPVINETENVTFAVTIMSDINCLPNFEWFVDDILFRESLDNSFMYSTGYADSGVYRIRVNASCAGLEVSHEWNLTVLDVNRVPVLVTAMPVGNTSVYEGENVTFTVNAIDHDQDALDYTWKSGDLNTTTTEHDIIINWTEAGNYTVSLLIDDGRGGTLEHTWKVEVKKKVVEPPPKPPGTSAEESLWWLILPLLGIFMIVVMALVYRKYLDRRERGKAGDGKEDGTSEEYDDMSPPGRVG